MENEVEQLFNSLIKRWRVSFGDYDIAEFDQIGNTFVAINYESKVIGQFNIRQLVSKESWLWQFCCKNRLTNRDGDWSKNAERDEDWVIDRDCLIFSSDYEYWLIESALKDEDELESFILDNIKVDVESK